MDTSQLNSVDVGDMHITYREAGTGEPVLLVHGWPTSSFLWRDVMAPVARSNRVIAIDLPGFGGSSKPTHVRYDFPFFDAVLDGFLDAVGVGDVAIGVHDLGGPVGLHWALHRPRRVTGIALLNTLIYPEFDDSVVEFVTTLIDPSRRDSLTSDEGLAGIMRLGTADQNKVTSDVLAGVTTPFSSQDDRLALARAGIGLHPDGFVEMAKLLPSVTCPVRIVYGEQDRVLPDVADTMARVAADVPHAVVTALPGCGHFLQEDDPEQVGELLADFFAGPGPTS